MIGDRVRAVASCHLCNWSAEHTGDDAMEVGTFLRRLLIAHSMHFHFNYYETRERERQASSKGTE